MHRCDGTARKVRLTTKQVWMICSEESSDGREALPPLRGGCNVALSHAKTLTVIAETRVGVRVASSTLRSLRRFSDNSNGYRCLWEGGKERGRELIGKMHCLMVCFPARRKFCQLGPYGVMLLLEYVASGVDFREGMQIRYTTLSTCLVHTTSINSIDKRAAVSFRNPSKSGRSSASNLRN